MKHIHATAAFLLATAALITGCGNTTEQSKTANTTAPPSTTIPEEEGFYSNEANCMDFLTYEDFLTEYTKDTPNRYVYPLPEIVNSWDFQQATLNPSNYQLSYNDPEKQTSVTLEIDFATSFETTSDYLASMENYYSFSNSEIVEQEERYFVEHYLEFDSYALYGFTGAENIMYTLTARSLDAGDSADQIALLKQYKEVLAL